MNQKDKIGEKELALDCAKGDNTARKELYNRYATRLYSLCCRYSTDREEGKDLLHDTMIRAFDKIGRFHYRGEGSLYAWLRKIAVNMAIERIRRDRRISFQELSEDIHEEENPDGDSVREIPLRELNEMVSALPDAKRMIFNMFCVDGYSHEEISKLLGITVGTSTSTLAKAKKLLAARICEYLKNKM